MESNFPLCQISINHIIDKSKNHVFMKPLRFYSKVIKKTIVVTLVAVIMLILLSLICKFAFIKTMQ